MPHDFELRGSYFCLDGAARKTGLSHGKLKLCVTATDPKLLAQFLQRLSESEDCYFVKYSAKPKDGMYLGRCFFTTDERVGEVWARYKAHPRLMCSIQDDSFTEKFRDQVRAWDSFQAGAIE